MERAASRRCLMDRILHLRARSGRDHGGRDESRDAHNGQPRTPTFRFPPAESAWLSSCRVPAGTAPREQIARSDRSLWQISNSSRHVSALFSKTPARTGAASPPVASRYRSPRPSVPVSTSLPAPAGSYRVLHGSAMSTAFTDRSRFTRHSCSLISHRNKEVRVPAYNPSPVFASETEALSPRRCIIRPSPPTTAPAPCRGRRFPRQRCTSSPPSRWRAGR